MVKPRLGSEGLVLDMSPGGVDLLSAEYDACSVNLKCGVAVGVVVWWKYAV
jgi:hypothetical protein